MLLSSFSLCWIKLKFETDYIRGGEWSFQKYGSRKIFVRFLGSRSLDFCADVSVSESRIFARLLVTIDHGLAF